MRPNNAPGNDIAEHDRLLEAVKEHRHESGHNHHHREILKKSDSVHRLIFRQSVFDRLDSQLSNGALEANLLASDNAKTSDGLGLQSDLWSLDFLAGRFLSEPRENPSPTESGVVGCFLATGHQDGAISAIDNLAADVAENIGAQAAT